MNVQNTYKQFLHKDDHIKQESFESYFTNNLYADFMNSSNQQTSHNILPENHLMNNSSHTNLNYDQPLLQYYAFQVVKKKIKNKKIQKNFTEREGDWTCFNCKNLNFSFRKKCNRCKISKLLSDNQHEKYLQSILTIIENNQIIRNQICGNK
jgi:hypothetical protein